MRTKICEQCNREYKWNKNNRCSTCRARDQRKKNKKAVYDLLGGECKLCGYDKCSDALDLHHLENKEFEFAEKWHCNLASLLEEAEKCILLCANCHRELHAGVVESQTQQI